MKLEQGLGHSDASLQVVDVVQHVQQNLLLSPKREKGSRTRVGAQDDRFLLEIRDRRALGPHRPPLQSSGTEPDLLVA